MNSSSMELGPIGIWTAQLDYQPAPKAKEAAAELEQLGFGAIWFPKVWAAKRSPMLRYFSVPPAESSLPPVSQTSTPAMR